jgi:DNA-binding beta-propeller fold protein YncE
VTGTLLYAQAATPVARVLVIPLPGVEGRIDHLAADAVHQRLFVAALGNNTLEVVDLKTERRIHTIPGLHEPQGIRYVPSSNRLFVANGQSGDCTVFDAASYQKRQNVPFGEDADNVRCDEMENRIYVGYGSGAIGILDAGNFKHLGTVPLAGHPESFQLEQHGPRIFVNVPNAGHIAVLDRQKQTLLATWPVTEARSNFPMALDEAGHRLFVGCRAPARLLVYDTDSGKVVTSLPIVGDTDDLFYDAARKRLYVSGGEGYLDVIAQENPDRYTRLQHIATAPGARTSFFVPELSRIYIAVPHRGSQAAALFVFAVLP